MVALIVCLELRLDFIPETERHILEDRSGGGCMDPHVVEIIAPLVSLLGMGTVGLIGMKMWLRSKVERQQLSGRLDMERLEESLCSLHDNMLSLRGRLSELHERVDFAERFLTEGGEKRSRRKELSETPP